MAGHFLNPFQRNPDDTVGGSIGRFHDADDDIGFGVLVLFVEDQTVIGMKFVTAFQPKLLGDETADNGFAPRGIEKILRPGRLRNVFRAHIQRW